MIMSNERLFGDKDGGKTNDIELSGWVGGTCSGKGGLDVARSELCEEWASAQGTIIVESLK